MLCVTSPVPHRPGRTAPIRTWCAAIPLAALAWSTAAADPPRGPAAAAVADAKPSPDAAAGDRPVAPGGEEIGAAGAGDLLLWEDIPPVIGAAKHEQKQREAPASVTVVTARDIELYGYRSLADILRTQRGFYLHSDGLSSFLGVRGFLRPGEWNARILVLVDGRPTREPIYGMTLLNEGLTVGVENIKRIEIIRGPGSALYGSNAVFAVINVITRDGADIKNWLEFRAQGGTKETGRAVATFGRKFANGLDVLLSASRFTSAGDRVIQYHGVHDADRLHGNLRNTDYEGSGSAFLKVGFHGLTFELDYGKRKKDNRAATYLTLWNNTGRMTEKVFNASLRWDHKIDDRRKIHAIAYYSRYDYDQPMDYDDGPPVGRYTYFSTAKADWLGADVHYDWQVTDRHRLIVGGEMTHSLSAEQKDWDTAYGLEVDTERWVRWWALYAQSEYTATDWLTLTGGLRMDVWGHFGTLLNPRAAAIFQPTEADTIKLLYGRAFRAPNLYEMYYTIPGWYRGNPDLRPEINSTYELVWSHEFANGWRSELSGYHWRMRRSLVDTYDPATFERQCVNDGIQQATGIEAEVEKRWKSGVRLRVSGSVGRAVDEDHKRLAHSPDYILNVAGAIPVINKRTFLSAETQFLGSMRSDRGSKSRPSYVTNIVLTTKDALDLKGLDLDIGVYNLFSELVEMPPSGVLDHSQPWLRHPGTMVFGGLRYRF